MTGKKSRKIKNEYIALIVIIIALAFYLVMRQDNRVHYKIPKLDTISQASIEKIDFTLKDKHVEITKKDGKWYLGEKNYLADEKRVKSMIETISGLTLTELVSRSKNYAPYELDDEKKIDVKAFGASSGDGNGERKLLREFFIGKQGPTYEHTFVKLAKDDRVFLAKKSFRGYFDRGKEDDLRDKVVMEFDGNEVSEITIKTGESEFNFTKNVPAEPEPKTTGTEGEKDANAPSPAPKVEQAIQWLAKDGKVGDKDKIDAFIRQFANLECNRYLEGQEKKDFENRKPDLTVIMKGTKEYKISIFPKLPEGVQFSGQYPTVTSESPYVFTLASYRGENFINDAKDMLKKEEKKENNEK